VSAAVVSRRRPARGYDERRRPQLRVVQRPRRAGRYLLTTLLVAALGVFAVVSVSALAAQQAFQAREVSAEVSELERRHDELVAQVAGLESPERIRAAADELGMVPASDPRYLGAPVEPPR